MPCAKFLHLLGKSNKNLDSNNPNFIYPKKNGKEKMHTNIWINCYMLYLTLIACNILIIR